MYNYKIKVRIHHPEVEKEVSVPLYSSLEEAESKLGRTRVLELVNESVLMSARVKTRNEMIEAVVKGKKI